MNISVIDSSLTSFIALIVTDWDDIDWDGIPEMIPVDESIDNPIGRDPDEIVNERPSPLIEGMIENEGEWKSVYKVRNR